MNTELYTILLDILNMIPSVVIEHVVMCYLAPQYLYSIKTPNLFYTFHFNKQLGIIYCASHNSYIFTDYATGILHDSSIIDVSKFNSMTTTQFWEQSISDITYFDKNDIIIYSQCNDLDIYSLHNKKYTCIQHANMYRRFDSYCFCRHSIGTELIYYRTMRFGSEYLIDMYNLDTCSLIKRSNKLKYASNDIRAKYYSMNSRMSIYNNIIYIYYPIKNITCKTISVEYIIYTHDATTLEQIDYYIFRRDAKHDALTIQGGKIYTYGMGDVNIYDAVKLNKIQSFSVKIFNNHSNTHNISVSNDLLAISNHEEMMIYDL
jgi:hypothetical protein